MKSNNPEAKLLVVDDEPNIRELLSTSLRFAGFDVVAAANGRDALTAAESEQPDPVSYTHLTLPTILLV